MVQLRDIKLDSLFLEIILHKALIMKKHFAPVYKMVSVCSFLKVAGSQDWELHQMDVHNALLHEDLEEEVYTKPSPGFRTEDATQVCRLHKISLWPQTSTVVLVCKTLCCS